MLTRRKPNPSDINYLNQVSQMSIENPKETQSILMIEQSRNFSCIGERCEAHCCYTWSVSVDKFTLEKWGEHPEANTLKSKLKIISNNEDQPTVVIKHNPETEACSFLEADQLCSLQKKFGHSFLPHTCRKFPRNEGSIDGIPERSYTLSCPEAARLILLPEDGLELSVIDDLDFCGPFYTNLLIDTEPKEAFNSTNRLELRVFALKILKDRRFKLEDRMILLGMLADSFEKSYGDGSIGIERSLHQFKEFIESSPQENIESLLKNIPSVPESKLTFLQMLCKIISPYANINRRYLPFFEKLVTLMEKKKESDTGKDVEENYLKYRYIFKSDFKFDYMLENYVFNSVFSSAFPIKNPFPLAQFLKIALGYALVREHLIVQYGTEPNVSQSTIIQLIQSFSRLYEHSDKLQKDLNNLISEGTYSSLPLMCILLRD